MKTSRRRSVRNSVGEVSTPALVAVHAVRWAGMVVLTAKCRCFPHAAVRVRWGTCVRIFPISPVPLVTEAAPACRGAAVPALKVPVLRRGTTDVLRVFPALLRWGLTVAVLVWWMGPVVQEAVRLAPSLSMRMVVPAVRAIVRAIVSGQSAL